MVSPSNMMDLPLPYIIINMPGQQGTTVRTWLHPDPRFSTDLTKLSAWEREYLRLVLSAIYRRLRDADDPIQQQFQEEEDDPWNDCWMRS